MSLSLFLSLFTAVTNISYTNFHVAIMAKILKLSVCKEWLWIKLCPYLPTPWSRVLLEKLTGFQLVKKFPEFYGTTHLAWTHIYKEKTTGTQIPQMYRNIGRKSRLSRQNMLLVYRTIPKPVWTYGVQLWGSASNCNIEILQRLQSKMLRIITDAPWYVPSVVIIRDLQVLSVGQEVRNYSVTYRQRLNDHPNSLAKSLFRRPN